MRRHLSLSLFSLLLTAACGPSNVAEDENEGIDEELQPVGDEGKEDSAGQPGPLVSTNTSATQVWVAKNKWEDRDTTAARAASTGTRSTSPGWPASRRSTPSMATGPSR